MTRMMNDPLPARTRPTRTVLVSALALSVAMLGLTASARVAAQDDVVGEDERPSSGDLLLFGTAMTTAAPAVRLGSDMDVTVTGTIARVKVTQVFRNTSDKWMEATYLYPLPQDGAVDSLKMVVGRRIIIGDIRRRAEARATYEQAKAQGRKAGLVEQQRPNIFSTAIANVGPGETVLVAIEYQAPVRQVAGRYSLRLPLVVGPRYLPPHSLQRPGAVADARTITAAPINATGKPLNPVSITVRLAPGFAPVELASAYHKVDVSGSGATRTIRLAGGKVPSNRDFELGWRLASPDPSVGLFRQKVGTQHYVMASITPPDSVQTAPPPPREMVFVIDNSGSMGGASMDQAKASLIHALETLSPQDHFNVIRFDDTLTQLFDHSVLASPEQVNTAVRFARSLKASGGTEMLPALKAALADSAATGAPGTLRQIIFLTDGDISNEAEMAAAIANDNGRSHLFPVGIGSAPNQYLMARMATMGRGTYTNIGSGSEVTAKTTALLEMLKRPVVRNVTVRVDGASLDLTPRILPDLYSGEPLVLLGKTDRLAGTMTISGKIGARLWSTTLDLADAVDSPSVAKLWARRRIDDVETERTLGRVPEEKADEAIAALGLDHHLVTSQTSLVAVDRTPSRPAGATLTHEDMPIELPAGWDFGTLFGGASGDAAAANEARAGHIADEAAQLDLPQTATDFAASFAAGLATLMIGALALIFLGRRRRGEAK